MVPGSTLRYGSNFIRLTLMPRLSSRHPMEAAASPLPSEDTTPPVTKMYFADIVSSPQLCLENCAGWCARSIMTERSQRGNGNFQQPELRLEFRRSSLCFCESGSRTLRIELNAPGRARVRETALAGLKSRSLTLTARWH